MEGSIYCFPNSPAGIVTNDAHNTMTAAVHSWHEQKCSAIWGVETESEQYEFPIKVWNVNENH